MKHAAKKLGIFLLETAAIAIKASVAAGSATTVIILTARYFHVLWL
jgi:hypothetical protein